MSTRLSDGRIFGLGTVLCIVCGRHAYTLARCGTAALRGQGMSALGRDGSMWRAVLSASLPALCVVFLGTVHGHMRWQFPSSHEIHRVQRDVRWHAVRRTERLACL
jgi:hypothetical protein